VSKRKCNTPIDFTLPSPASGRRVGDEGLDGAMFLNRKCAMLKTLTLALSHKWERGYAFLRF